MHGVIGRIWVCGEGVGGVIGFRGDVESRWGCDDFGRARAGGGIIRCVYAWEGDELFVVGAGFFAAEKVMRREALSTPGHGGAEDVLCCAGAEPAWLCIFGVVFKALTRAEAIRSRDVLWRSWFLVHVSRSSSCGIRRLGRSPLVARLEPCS